MKKGLATASFFALVALTLLVPYSAFAVDSKQLPDPDGKPADMSKPVQVYILLGQSNMLGFGKIAGGDQPGTLEHATKKEQLYPYLIDDEGNWTKRKDVRNVRVMGSGARRDEALQQRVDDYQGQSHRPRDRHWASGGTCH